MTNSLRCLWPSIELLSQTSVENMSLYRWPSSPLEYYFFGVRLLGTQLQVSLVGGITKSQLHLVGHHFERGRNLDVTSGCFENVISAGT